MSSFKLFAVIPQTNVHPATIGKPLRLITASPLFSVAGWNIHHAGIIWPTRESLYGPIDCPVVSAAVEATLLLALQPTNPGKLPSEFHGLSSGSFQPRMTDIDRYYIVP